MYSVFFVFTATPADLFRAFSYLPASSGAARDLPVGSLGPCVLEGLARLWMPPEREEYWLAFTSWEVLTHIISRAATRLYFSMLIYWITCCCRTRFRLNAIILREHSEVMCLSGWCSRIFRLSSIHFSMTYETPSSFLESEFSCIIYFAA